MDIIIHFILSITDSVIAHYVIKMIDKYLKISENLVFLSLPVIRKAFFMLGIFLLSFIF